MSANPHRNVAYKPKTTYRVLVRGEEKEPHMVCTVWPEPIDRPYSNLGLTHVTIPGAPGKNGIPQILKFGEREYVATIDGQPTTRYGFTLVRPGIERDDLGHVHTLSIVGISTYRVALDIIGLAVEQVSDEPNPDGTYPVLAGAIKTSPLFEKGYFVPEGHEPTEAEVAAAEKRRDNWLRRAVEKGDVTWAQEGKADRIHPDSVVAVRMLGLDRPWAPKTVPTLKNEVSCPVCASPVEHGVKKCLKCNEWLGYEADGSVYAVNDPERANKALAQAKARARLNQEA